MNDLKSQLAPGWSPMNIGLLVASFIILKPLALLMLGYILFGARLGLDIRQPDTFVAAWGRLVGSWKAGSRQAGRVETGGGTPSPVVEKQRDLDREAASVAEDRAALQRDREALERERAAFDAERKQREDA